MDTCCGYGYSPARELHLLFKGRRELTGRRQNRDTFQGVGPYLGTNPFQGAWPFKEKITLPGAPASFSEFVCVTALGASWHPSPPRPGSGIITRLPFDWPGTTEATVSPRRPSYSSRRIFVKYFFLLLTAGYGPDAPVPSIFRANWFGRWVVTHSLADSDFHQPMVTPPISTNTFPGVWWALALGALTRHLVHLAAPVLLIKSGPLGDSHSTPRLHLRPYTQVGWPICTSGPLRASTRVSSGFAPLRHSSPSFRYHRTRSCSTCLAGAVLHLHCAVGARGHLFTRACVRLLGLCFKMGRLGGRPRHRPRAPFTWGHEPPSPPTLPSQTEPAAAHRLGRSASDGGQTTCQTAVPNQGNPYAQTGTTRPAELNPLGSTIESTIWLSPNF